MVEIPCTIRCDGCKETAPANAEARYIRVGPDYASDIVHAFVISDDVIPAGWRITFSGELRCSRCNGIK